jgi:hypothetical protein
MFAQLTFFDGPLAAARVDALRRADADRIMPAIAADAELHGQLLANYVLSQSDGAHVVVTIVKTQAALARGKEVILGTSLLPGEDPELLPGPDRIEIYRVVAYTDADSALVLAE